MQDISRLKKRMCVIAADGQAIGFVSRMASPDKVRLTSLRAGHGYDHVIPVEWIGAIDRYVYLNKASAYVGANWEKAEPLCGRFVARVSDLAKPAGVAAGAGPPAASRAA